MRDLEIWSGEPSPEALVELSHWSLARRVPYFGRLCGWIERLDPAVRAAAVTALAGARGASGVRAIVRVLADPDPAVWRAALESLRITARDAPDRFAHAVFHPSVDVRRASLADMPQAAAGLAIYLRADPACAELTTTAHWPRDPLPLAFDLHAAGVLTAQQLLEVTLQVEPPELAAFFDKERRRAVADVDRYLDLVAASPALTAAPGHDIIDQLIAALEHELAGGAEIAGRVLQFRVMAIVPKKPTPQSRRILAALLSRLAIAPTRALLEVAIAIEPRLIEHASVQSLGERAVADAAIAGLFEYRWPVRPSRAQLDRLLELPAVRADLALAIAVVGLGGSRLKRLAKLFGETDIVARLVAEDRGWDELCKLPQETPALELSWLSKVEKTSPPRYLALAARALGVLRDRRLGVFVDQIPRRHRAEVFLAFARRTDVGEARLAAATNAIALRLDRAAATSVFAALLGGDLTQRKLARQLARELPDKVLATVSTNLTDDALARLVEICDGPDALPRDREVALAHAIAKRPHPTLQDWAGRVLEIAPLTVVQPVRPPTSKSIDETQRHLIATASDAELSKALGKALEVPVTGLVNALGARADGPSVPACAALLGCADPIEYVARELDRFADPSPRFDDRLDHVTAVHWSDVAELPPLGHARLFRWEAHTFALASWIDAVGGVLPAVMSANALPGLLAAKTLWSGIAEVVVFWRYRDHARLAREATTDLARYCASRIDRPIGRHAVRIVVALVEAKLIGVSAIKDIILDRTADADAETREHLARLVRLEGMPEPPPRIDAGVPTAELIERIKSSRDLGELVRWCTDSRPAVVEEAVLALLVYGEAGQMRLAQLLRELHAIPQPVPILASITLWDSAQALFAARALAARAELAPQWQFHLCIGLGDPAGALAAVKQPGTWFRRDDWDVLTMVVDPVRAAIELADVSHHHAYQRAIAILLEQPASLDVRDAMMRFLAVGSERPIQLRRSLAWLLLREYQVELGLPLVIEEIAEAPPEGPGADLKPLTPRVAAIVASAIVDAALIGGHTACTEKRMWQVLVALQDRLDAATLAELYTRILENASTAGARRQASQLVLGEALRAQRLARVAEVFAWGVRRGVELTGRLFRIHLTSKERDLGHTFLEGNRIFVSPLPMLREEAYGQDVVEGLLLHEIGHHVYHRGEQPQALWKKAHDEGIGHLLNLIADEHLERNLRGVDRAYGDRLKRLDAYAFQHGAHEIAVESLLGCLRGSAAVALIGTPLEVAFDEKSVRLRRGAVLIELERTGHPLARFARALRMGLGNRTGDPLVAQALDLCGGGLKKLDMRGLYDLTVELAELFGGSIAIAKVFGGSEGIEFGERDDDVFGGFDDDILQREVERILDPRRNKSASPPGGRDRLCINVNPDEEFDRITHVQRVKGDPVKHRATMMQVMRHAHRLRAFLDDLGLRWQPQRARIQGRALDRTRLRGLVTKNDPRILIAREPTRRTDLFLGTVIDCSGSMGAGDNIERARRFAVLIAEAVRPLAGVEARFFGFTDSAIYDAGDARDCEVTGLEAGGGNNDAAALYHVANIAAQSQKRAKVLVMISDGLPTECSVAALKGLVTTLTRRRGVVCAQVAVRRLEEECFPHYVVLDDAQPDIAVARFGRMIADLARRGLTQ